MRLEDKITLGLLDNGTVRGEFAHDLFVLGASRRQRFNGVLHFRDSLISRGRNVLMQRFLEGESEWLFMVDADQRIDIEDFDRLVEAADADERPVMSGLTFTIEDYSLLYPMPLPSMYSSDPSGGEKFFAVTHYPANQVIEVDAVGAAILLVHRRVVEEVKKFTEHWFLDYPLEDGSWLGEDMYFSNMVRKAGFPIHVHTGAVSEHIKTYAVKEEHYIQYRDYFDERDGKPE